MTNTLYCDDCKKQCPVCGAFTFENARLCYGCMYRFNDDAGVNMHSLTATGTSSLERVSGSAPTSLSARTGAFASPSAAMGASAYTCVPATTSRDAYVQRLPCEPGNCFSSYKTY